MPADVGTKVVNPSPDIEFATGKYRYLRFANAEFARWATPERVADVITFRFPRNLPQSRARQHP
jgi:hypothetical protein